MHCTLPSPGGFVYWGTRAEGGGEAGVPLRPPAPEFREEPVPGLPAEQSPVRRGLSSHQLHPALCVLAPVRTSVLSCLKPSLLEL